MCFFPYYPFPYAFFIEIDSFYHIPDVCLLSEETCDGQDVMIDAPFPRDIILTLQMPSQQRHTMGANFPAGTISTSCMH